ncbi:MAG: hypothetical protein FWD57_15640, partial [Polyangiaceae bacterium]|nr:hypothetical protein [Polyangiaceae bacterium]
DDVCYMHGIDYNKLRSIAGGTPWDSEHGGPKWDAESMAEVGKINPDLYNSYIGDYVTKLDNFVEYYNIKYPSHDGDDTAVLSLREDFIPGGFECVRDAPNLLYFSDRLHDSHYEEIDDVEVLRGWQTNADGDSSPWRLDVMDGKALEPPTPLEPEEANEPPTSEGPGGVTWLIEKPDLGDVISSGPIPSRTVWQSVDLDPGTYLLSWRDQARSLDGEITVPGPYTAQLQVVIYNESWLPIAVKAVIPHIWDPADPEKVWSERRTIEAAIKTPGVYHIGLSISMSADESPGSVAIANVQLEKVTAPGSDPSPYVRTEKTRKHLTMDCGLISAEEFRSQFKKLDCTGGLCHYELETPLILDTSTLGTPLSRLNGKLAGGNFNLRHITLALNLVGTGVRDCPEGSGMSCYGSGFTEYSLDHNAFEIELVGWDGKVTAANPPFNFGLASINHGKALSTERYITFPIGSADSSMLSQPGIEKTEFRGRPLDGSYRLRIWDDGSLQWDRLEDIQLVIKYRYWSKIIGEKAK